MMKLISKNFRVLTLYSFGTPAMISTNLGWFGRWYFWDICKLLDFKEKIEFLFIKKKSKTLDKNIKI